jgi:beta-fructofuranosidase
MKDKKISKINRIISWIIIIIFSAVLISCNKDVKGEVSDYGEGMVNGDMKKIDENYSDFRFELGTISTLAINNPKVHYQQNAGWLGDCHPIFYKGRWYLYYLDLPYNTPNRNTLSGVRQGLAVSDDLINWEKVDTSISNNKDWYAIANILVGNQIYSMFNDTVTNMGYGLATSEDGISFHNEGVVYPYSNMLCNEARDPAIFYDEVKGQYIFIHAGKNHNDLYPNVQGLVYYSVTKDFTSFSDEQILYDAGDCNVAECPEMFKLGNKYYLIMNWDTNRVGTARYVVSDSPYGPFRKPLIDTFSSIDFSAPNSNTDGSRQVSFGWIPTKNGNTDNGGIQWGGVHALPRVLYSGANGELFTKLDIENSLIRDSKLYESASGRYSYVRGNGWNTDGKGFFYDSNSSYGELWLEADSKSFDMEMDISVGADNTGAGVVFKTGNSGFNGYEIFIDPVTNQLIFRNHFEKQTKITAVPISINRSEKMKLRIIVDGNTIEVFLNDKYSLTARNYTSASKNVIGLFAENGKAGFTNIEIYSLKSIYDIT